MRFLWISLSLVALSFAVLQKRRILSAPNACTNVRKWGLDGPLGVIERERERGREREGEREKREGERERKQ